MSEVTGLKAKLGVNVFKPDNVPHIRIIEGMNKDPRVRRAILLCPAGLYRENDQGEVEFTIDGCLECGTCRIACGSEVLEWDFPAGGSGVQFRYG